jgi:predicted polyphosphate/ATP-dependent NAD kinase
MGGEEAAACGLEFTALDGPSGMTTPRHTRDAARAMAEQGVDLLLFVGGDGTACDICEAVGDRLMVLGIPAGVKIHSGVYAISPDAAGRLAAEFVQGRCIETMAAEVMDQDEEALRKGRVSVRLHGYLDIPRHRALTQGSKSSSAAGEQVAARIAAAEVASKMETGRTYIIGPGTTTRELMAALGLAGTLVGVDVVRDGQLLVKDAGEQQILELIKGRDTAIVVTVIGGQGYLFGRGNQQISAKVIREVGADNIIVVATRQKLNGLRWRGLLVDTGDEEVDAMLGGYVRIVTGSGEQSVCKVGDQDLNAPASIEPPATND